MVHDNQGQRKLPFLFLVRFEFAGSAAIMSHPLKYSKQSFKTCFFRLSDSNQRFMNGSPLSLSSAIRRAVITILRGHMKNIRSILLATTALGFLFVAPAHAADTTTDAIKTLQEQVNALQKQLTEMQAKAAAPAAAPAATAEAGKKEVLPGVNVKLGGYLAMEGLYRDHNQTTDMSSSFAGVPYENGRGANQDEFRMSARQTRLSLLAEGKVDEKMKLLGYVESDFMGSANTSNSVQSNSYTPRLRQAFGQVDKNDWGMHFVAGQTWSLVSLSKGGMMPRNEAGPIMVDSTGTPGYVYTRNAQVRFVKDFADKKAQFGVSVEGPQANVAGLPCTANSTSGTCTAFKSNYILRNTGVSALNTDTSYSMDYAPDVIAKVGYDMGMGRVEAFGLSRFFRNTVAFDNTYRDNYAVGVGGGIGTFLNVIPKKLEVQANFLAGKGVGRYSSAQMPDFAVTPSGDIKPVMMYSAMVGAIAHPTPTWDLYAYAGVETALRQEYNNTAYGYGSALANLNNCYRQQGISTANTCNAMTQTVWQVAPGFWNTVYKGDYGNIKWGAQYSFTRKDAFSGLNDKQPHAYENMVFTSIRYSPF